MAKEINIKYQNREIFNKTFLYNVSILCSFEKDDLSTSFDRISAIFENSVWSVMTSNNLALTFENKSSFLIIGKNSIMLSIPKADYVSFEGISDTIELINDIQHKINNTIKEIAIVKTNRYNIKHEDNKGEVWMKELLFSKEFYSMSKLKEPFEQSFNDISIISNVGFFTKDNVDTIEYRIFASSKIHNNFKDDLIDLNQKIFDVWRWSVSENMIELMRRKDK